MYYTWGTFIFVTSKMKHDNGILCSLNSENAFINIILRGTASIVHCLLR